MIRINADIFYLMQNYGINIKTLKEMSPTKSLEEIMEAEAENGNTKVANFKHDLFCDPEELIKLFKLIDPANRYQILHSMNQNDLKYFTKLMEPEDLAFGLNFFTKDQIMTFLAEIPQEELFQILKKAFSNEKMLELIPEKELDKFVKSTDIEKDILCKGLKSLPAEELAKMLEYITGQPVDEDSTQKDNFEKIEKFSLENIQKSFEILKPESKQKVIGSMLSENESLIKCFSSKALTEPLDIMQKEDITKLMSNLEPKHLNKMIEELPEDLMAIVCTQLDVAKFTNVLIQNFQNVLSKITLK